MHAKVKNPHLYDVLVKAPAKPVTTMTTPRSSVTMMVCHGRAAVRQMVRRINGVVTNLVGGKVRCYVTSYQINGCLPVNVANIKDLSVSTSNKTIGTVELDIDRGPS